MLIRKSIFISSLIALFAAGLFADKIVEMLGSTDSPSTPESTESYTMNDLYNRLNAGTAGSQSTFTEPTVAPGTPTTHTLNEIVALAPVQDNTHGATVSDVLSTKTFWGLSSGAWGLQTGTVTTGNNVTGSEGATSVIIPDGIYTGSKTATFQDADLVSSNIKAGVDLYGVTGNIPVTDRFTDHGDGTITDHKTGLMWMKNVRHTDSCLPEFARIYCETFTFAGYSDWRVPSIIELCHLIDQTQTRPALPSGHPFTIDNSSILIISRSVTAASGSGREEVSYLFLAGGHIADSRWYESNDSYLTAGFLWPVRTAL